MSGSIFATGSNGVKLWSLTQSASTPLSSTKAGVVADLIWLPGGHHLVSCDAQSGIVSCAKFSSTSGLAPSKPFTSLPSGGCALASLRSSSHFLVAGTDHAVRLVTVADGTVQRTFMGQVSPIRTISCSSSDTCVAVAQDNASVVLHWLAGKTPSSRFAVPECTSIQRLQFSNHQDNLLAVACNMGRSMVWDVSANKLHASFSSHNDKSLVADISFSPRNPLLMVSAGTDRQLVFHDVPKKMYIRSFQCESALTSAAILHDGFTVAVGTDSGAVLVYDLRAGDSVKERIASAHSAPVTVVTGRPPSSSSSSGGSAGRKSKSSTSSTSSSGYSGSKVSSASSDRQRGVSTRLASEASPSLPSLSEAQQSDTSQHTPALLDSKRPTHSAAHSASSGAASSASPLNLSSVSQSSAQRLLSRAPVVSSIGRTAPAPASITAANSISASSTTAAPAIKPASAIMNFGDSDIFSPLRPAPPSSSVGSHHQNLSSSPQLPSAAPSAVSHTDFLRRNHAEPIRPSPLVSTSLERDATWSSTSLRSLQQAEGMETSKPPPAKVTSSFPPSVPTSSVSQRYSSLVTTASSSAGPSTSVLQHQALASVHGKQAHHSAAILPMHRALLSRDDIDGSEADSPARPFSSALTSPQSLGHRHILGAASSSSMASSQATTATTAMSTVSPSHSPSHSLSSVPALASALERMASPGQQQSQSSLSSMPSARPSSAAASTVYSASASVPAATATAAGSIQPVPFHAAALQRMVEQSVDELRLAMHQHIRNVHVNLIRQIGDQTAELLAAQAQQYEVTEALLMEMQLLREEVRRLQERY